MKLDSVDRYSSWRPNSADARAVAASRLQTVVSSNSPAAPQALNSGRELPILPVKQGDNVQSRPVLQSDKPKGADPALNLFREFKPTAPATTTATVDAFPNPKPAASKDASTASPQDPLQKKSAADTATGLTPANEADPADQKAAAAKELQSKETAKEAAKASAETTRQRAAEEAKNQPPKEPISKMLLDLVHSVWAASGSVVDAATPQPKPGSPAATDEAAGDTASSAGSASLSSPPPRSELTYAPSATGLRSSSSK